jgi:hypothetical protein
MKRAELLQPAPGADDEADDHAKAPPAENDPDYTMPVRPGAPGINEPGPPGVHDAPPPDHIITPPPENPGAVPPDGAGAFARLPASAYDSLFTETADRLGLNAALLKAICFAESNFRPDVVSRSGALGLMQLMPFTAEALGVTDPLDPWQNVDGGARYLAQLLDRFNGNALLALAAYNCGYPAVESRGVTDLSNPYQRGLLPSETQGYIARIEEYLGAAQALHVLEEPFSAVYG